MKSKDIYAVHINGYDSKNPEHRASAKSILEALSGELDNIYPPVDFSKKTPKKPTTIRVKIKKIKIYDRSSEQDIADLMPFTIPESRHHRPISKPKPNYSLP